jgi:flagellar secretion chaperone FliS
MNQYLKGNVAYKKAAVTTKDQGTLILMLYDGAIRFLKTALIKLNNQDLEKAHQYIVKAKNIVSELMTSLKTDDRNKVATDLKSLYTYMFNRLIDANIQKDASYVYEVQELLEELREGWRGVIDNKKQVNSGFNNRSEVKPLKIQG